MFCFCFVHVDVCSWAMSWVFCKKLITWIVSLDFTDGNFFLILLQMVAVSSKIPHTVEETMDVEAQVEREEYQRTQKRGKAIDGDATSGVSSQSKKVMKVVVPRSGVWKNFTWTKESRDRCIGHYYRKIFSCATKSGTSNLQKHLSICKEYQTWLTSQGTNQIEINTDGNQKSSKVAEAVFREASNELIVLVELPLSFIESTAWKHLCRKVIHLINPYLFIFFLHVTLLIRLLLILAR